jgi:Carboxypeptidase regulatory-like domain/TonB-dependent Receptor Plug Domain
VISLRSLTFGVFLIAVSTLGTASAASAPTPQAEGKTASIHGTVISLSGAPLANARVVAQGASGEASTNERGQYRLTGLTPGVSSVTITAPGFDPFEVKVTVAAGTDTEADAVMMATPRPVEPVSTAPVPASPAENPTGAAPARTTPEQEQAPVAAPAASPQTVVAPQNFSVKPERGRSALYGIVTDQTGAVIQGGTASASVTGSNPIAVPVNAQGRYVLSGLAPGNYHLKVEAPGPGFAPFEGDITLAADQALEVDATLTPPSKVETVNVEGNNTAEVKTSESHIEGTITEQEVQKTGLNGRNFTQLIALAPGVSNQTGQDEALVGVKGSVKYSVNGGRVEYNSFDVDGSDVLNAGLNGAESTLMVYPSLDAISEVKVLTSNYGAMYGKSASGTVLVTTKSGTKDYHGGLYDFIRNEFFNARNYFDETTKAPLYRRQDFGGTLGGPLYIPGVFNSKKDKTYFFWSEEFRLEKTPQEFNQAVPGAAERGIGVTCPGGPYTTGANAGSNSCADFSDVCPVVGSTTIDLTLYPDCPIASGVQTGSGFTPVPFANNLIPINPTSATLLQSGMIPLPNSSIGCNSSLAGTIGPSGQLNTPCYDAVISPSTYWREELARIDHNFTQSLRLSFRYIHDSWDTTVATPEWGYVQNSFPTVQNRLNGPGTSMIVRLTDTISSSLLNEFVIGYVDSHITLRDQPLSGVTLPPIPQCSSATSSVCMNYLFNNGAGGKPPGLVIAGTNQAYGGNGFAVDASYPPWEHTSPTYGLADNLSKAWGEHTVQVGIQVTDAQRNETNGAIGAATGDLQGIFTYSNQNNVTSGNVFADFLAGPGSQSPCNTSTSCSFNLIKSYQQDSAQLRYYNDYWIAEPYLQDDWRISRRLTLNLGLRMSLFWNYHEKNLNAWNWVASDFQPSVAATATLAPYLVPGLNGGFFESAVGNCAKYGACKAMPFDANNPSNISPALAAVLENGLVQCGKNGVPASCMTNHIFNPSPRVGFAWDPQGDGKTSIRGGYGIFFEHGTAKEANTGSLEGSSPPVLTMTAPLPFNYQSVGFCAYCSPNTQVAFPLDVTSIPTQTTWPYVQQWSISVQRQLPADMVGTVAYVGSKGTHLSAELQMNQLAPPPTGIDTGIFPNGNPFNSGQPITVGGDCKTYGDPTPNAFTINGIAVTASQPAFANLAAACFATRDPISGQPNLAIPNPDLLRPYFGFHRVLALRDIADSQYHALQATLRRTRGPVTIGVSYTYSHSLDDSSDRSDANFVNSANIKSSWASSNFDQRHLFNFNYIYSLPKLASDFERWFYREPAADAQPQGPQDGPKILRVLFNDWQISGITLFQSGTPFSVINGGSTTGISVQDNAGVANGAGSGSYPDVVGDPKAAFPVGVTKFNPRSIGPLLFNPAAFAAPQGLTFGDAGRNFLNNPHRINFDASLLKNFKVTEGSNLEFRLEAFNVFNHTQFRIFNPNIGNAANNTINCYGGGTGSLPYTAAGGYTVLPGSVNPQPEYIDCTTGSAFLRPIDAHRPRTIQLGLKYSF